MKSKVIAVLGAGVTGYGITEVTSKGFIDTQ